MEEEKSIEQKIENSVECRICGKSFANGFELELHFTTSHEKTVFDSKPDIQKLYQCDYCERICSNANNLRKHVDLLHSDKEEVQKQIQCDVCGLTFKNEYNRKSHTNFVHRGNDKKIKCGQCSKLFEKNNLKIHIARVHDKSNAKFRCDICDTLFQDKCSLEKHKQLKHELRKEQCDIC